MPIVGEEYKNPGQTSLDKNPGLRPTGVSEVIRRIIGKLVVHTLIEDIIRSVGNVQLYAGHELGCEGAIIQ